MHERKGDGRFSDTVLREASPVGEGGHFLPVGHTHQQPEIEASLGSAIAILPEGRTFIGISIKAFLSYRGIRAVYPVVSL